MPLSVSERPRWSTRPTTMWWSPASWTWWIWQSAWASVSWMSGHPVVGAGDHETPANLSVPLPAIWLDSSDWSAERKLTQNLPDRWIAGHAREVLAGMNSTRGGLSETEENDWQVR